MKLALLTFSLILSLSSFAKPRPEPEFEMVDCGVVKDVEAEKLPYMSVITLKLTDVTSGKIEKSKIVRLSKWRKRTREVIFSIAEKTEQENAKWFLGEAHTAMGTTIVLCVSTAMERDSNHVDYPYKLTNYFGLGSDLDSAEADLLLHR